MYNKNCTIAIPPCDQVAGFNLITLIPSITIPRLVYLNTQKQAFDAGADAWRCFFAGADADAQNEKLLGTGAGA